MFCANCGRNIEGTHKFCSGCGAPVAGRPVPPPPPVPTPPPIPASPFAQPTDAAGPTYGGRPSTYPTGTRDDPGRSDLIYPKPHGQSPHLCWLNLFVTGLAQMMYGQVGKGILWLVIFISSNLVLPFLGMCIVAAISIVDAYQVGRTLRSGRPVGKWKFFPG